MPHPDEQNAVRPLLHEIERPVIVELGAHIGEDEFWICSACRDDRIRYIMVEPDPRNIQRIRGRGPLYCSPDSQRSLWEGAISDRIETREFNFAFNLNDQTRASGSIRRPTGHLHHIPQVIFDGSGMVQCWPLDYIFEQEQLPKIDLLWVDIQGAENLMIRGGQQALKHTRYLFMEVEQLEMYEGESLKTELLSMLPGWRVLREFEFNVLMENQLFPGLWS